MSIIDSNELTDVGRKYLSIKQRHTNTLNECTEHMETLIQSVEVSV
jgi:hypothetical protein